MENQERAYESNNFSSYENGLNERENFLAMFYEKDDYISRLEKSARNRKVPIIRCEMVQFMELILSLHQPKRILEVGTAIGFSALLMSQYLPEGGKLITIERNPVMWQEAKQNFADAEQEASLYGKRENGLIVQPKKIELLVGDAADILPSLTDSFDFIFLDSAKAQYINFLPHLVRLLNKGGMLVTDNILQNGEIIHSKHLLIRRERTTHRRMREYLWAIREHEELDTKYFGFADGVTVSIKK